MLSKRGQRYTNIEEFIFPIIKSWSDRYHPTENPNGYINLGVAETSLNKDLLIEKLTQIRKEIPVNPNTFGYGDFVGSETLRTHLSRFYKKHLFKTDVNLNPSDFLVQGGCNVVLENVGGILCDDDDEILVDAPLYLAFEADFKRRFNVHLNFVPMDCEQISKSNFIYRPNLDRLKQHYEKNRDKIKAILLCHPHNPTGSLYTDEYLNDLLDFCCENDIHLISDEVYALSMLNGNTFKSIYSYVLQTKDDDKREKLEQLVHHIYSISKDWGLNGFRMAILHTRNEGLKSAMMNLADVSQVSRDTMFMMEKFFEDEKFLDQFIETNQKRLNNYATIVCDFFKKHGIPFVKPESTMFVYFNLHPKYVGHLYRDEKDESIQDQKKVFEKFFEEGKVMFAQGRFFRDVETHWYRVCFTCMEDEKGLLEGLNRLINALGK